MWSKRRVWIYLAPKGIFARDIVQLVKNEDLAFTNTTESQN